jgi:hypothetical protein
VSDRGGHQATRAALALVLAMGLAMGASVSSAQTGSASPVVLTWTAPGDDGNSGRASSYDIRWRTVGITGTDTLTWWNNATQVAGEPYPGIAGSTDSMLVTGLAVGTTYYFMMKAGDEVPNWSGYSNLTSATVQACDGPTNAPSNVTADEDTSAVDVVLTWSGTPSPSDPSNTVHIYRATGGGAFALKTTLPGTPTTWRDTSVSAGTTYRYEIAWAVPCGDGPRSSTVTIATAPPVGGPPPPGSASSGAFHVYPNPSSGPIQMVVTVTGTTAARAHIRLYTLTGKWIADLVDDTFDPGEHTVSWSRTSRGGQTVSPGYYEAIGTVGASKVRERIVLIP